MSEKRKFQGQTVTIDRKPDTSTVIFWDADGNQIETRRFATAELDKILAAEDGPRTGPARVRFDDRTGTGGEPPPAAVVPPVEQGKAVGSGPEVVKELSLDWPPPNLKEADDQRDPKLPSLAKGESVRDYQNRTRGERD